MKKKKLMLIINPVAGKARYKDGFGDVMRNVVVLRGL